MKNIITYKEINKLLDLIQEMKESSTDEERRNILLDMEEILTGEER